MCEGSVGVAAGKLADLPDSADCQRQKGWFSLTATTGAPLDQMMPSLLLQVIMRTLYQHPRAQDVNLKVWTVAARNLWL